MIITGVIILGALIWAVGAFTVLGDLMNWGKSLDAYREDYGKDLGLLICCVYRGAMIFAWPVMGIGGFLIGLISDTIKLVFK